MINLTKQEINNKYRNKKVYIIKSTNNFISNMLSSHMKYILIYLNKKEIIEDYLQSKINFISHNFNEYSSQLKNLSQNVININNQNKNNFALSKENYDLTISSILTNLKIFVNKINLIIKTDFNKENCFEHLDDSTSDYSDFTIFDNTNNNTEFIDEKSDQVKLNNLFCKIILNKNEYINYEYNFNIVKLRTGLNYTKNIIENLMNMIDGFYYDEMLNISYFNENEYLINDNDILFIENSTLNKLKEINKNSNILLDGQNQQIIEDILKKYNLNDDYYEILKKFIKVMNFQNENIKIYTNNIINDLINSINALFNEFNKTLYEQKNKYNF